MGSLHYLAPEIARGDVYKRQLYIYHYIITKISHNVENVYNQIKKVSELTFVVVLI